MSSRRTCRCGLCGQTGHNARSCQEPLLEGTPLPPPEPGGSPSDQAALYVAATGCSLQEAGDRYGISWQSVQYAWTTLYPGIRTPRRAAIGAASQDRAREMVDLANAGVHQAEIARLVGVCHATVRERLEAVGVQPPGPLSTSPGVEAAVLMVQSGVAIAGAAAAHGVSYQAVAKCLANRGIKSRPRRRRPDGRTMRAVERVLAGATIAEASRAEQCSPSSVSVYVKRIRENTDTQLA